MCKHQFKWDRQSMVIIKGKCVVIDIWKCIHCGELQIIDKDKCKIISLGGKLGKEVNFDK